MVLILYRIMDTPTQKIFYVKLNFLTILLVIGHLGKGIPLYKSKN